MRLRFVKMTCCSGVLALAWTSGVYAGARDNGAPAQASKTASEIARKIIDQNIRARGGKKALARISTVNFEGAVVTAGGGPSGTYSLIGKAPEQMYQEIQIGAEQLVEGSNGISVWRQEDAGGPRTLRGAAAGALVARARLLNGALLDYKKQKISAEFAGSEAMNGRNQMRVRVRFAPGLAGDLYFDAATHLLARELFTEPGAADNTNHADSNYGKRDTDETDYSDYRAVNGVEEPFRIIIRRASRVFEIAVNKVVLNAPVETETFEFPGNSKAALPDIGALLMDLNKNQAAVEALVKTYTYREIDEEDEDQSSSATTPDKKSVKEYDVFYLGGDKVSRLVARDGRPLSPKDQEKEDARVGKQVEEYKKQQAKMTDKQRQKQDAEDQAAVSTFLRVARFTNPRWERFRGAQVVVFDFSGNPDYKPRSLIERFLSTLSGTLWVDPQARDVARLEARMVNNVKIGGGIFASVQKNSGFVFEQQLVNGEVWLPSYAEAHVFGRVLLFKGFRANEVDRFSNYKKFDVTAKILPASAASPSAGAAGATAVPASPPK